MLEGLTGDVSITKCTFQDNRATMYLWWWCCNTVGLESNLRITNCTFQNNSATIANSGGAAMVEDQQAI